VRRIVPACVLLFVAGCGQTHPGALQRLDKLRSPLKSAGQLSDAVAQETRTINRGMAKDNRRQITLAAKHLERDARRLRQVTRDLLPRVNRLAKESSDGVDSDFIRLTLATLWHQSWEAHWAVRLAHTVHADPFLSSPRNYNLAMRQSRMAHRAAAGSVTSVSEARALEERHRDTFGLASSSQPRGAGKQGGKAE
jgi:hypothetical protein